MSDADRRRESRIPLDQRCWCEGDDITLFSRVINASQRGVFLLTATPLGIGDRARLVWNSPEGEQAIAMAEVAWIRKQRVSGPPGMGLRLVSFIAGEKVWQSLLQRFARGSES